MASNEDYLDSLLANINNQTNGTSDEFFDEMSKMDEEDLMSVLNDESDTPEETDKTSDEDIMNVEEAFDGMNIEENVENLIPSEDEFDGQESTLEYVTEVALGDDMNESEDISDEVPEETEEKIPSEEILDMDEIDAILSDVSDIHPERSKTSEELEERIARYEENPEAAEEALLKDDTEETPAEEMSDEEEIPNEDEIDDLLGNLEDVDALLADVENRAKEEEERIAAERSETFDGDLDEINDILNKSDNNEAVNDDLLSMIEGLDEGASESEEGLFEESEKEEEKGKKAKKEKKEKKKKKEAEASSNEGGEKEKKDGFFAKLLGFMFEADEEEEEENKTESDNPEENKGKKDKKKKGKKGAKADDNAAIEAELDEEDSKEKKGKKEKKPKKEKAPKKEKKPKPEQTEEKQKSAIKTKGIILTFAFCATLLAVILFATVLGPKVLARNEARIAYYNKDYETASNKLYGMKLSESDRLIYEKASVLYRLDLFYDKVEAYEVMNDRVKMLDALLQTWEESKKVSVDASILSIEEEVDEYRNNVEKKLFDEFGITAEDVITICDMKPVYYTLAVEKLAAGENYKETTDEPVTTEEHKEEETEELEDMLPEEIGLLDGLETEK